MACNNSSVNQGCQSNPIEITCRLLIAEFCIDWIYIDYRFLRVNANLYTIDR